MLSLVLSAGGGPPAPELLVPLSLAGDDHQAAVEAARTRADPTGLSVLTREDFLGALYQQSSIPPLEAVDAHAIAAALERARQQEVEWNTRAANEIRRELLDTFNRAARATEELRAAATAAARELVASLHSEQDPSAVAVALDMVRRFPNAPDARYCSPPVMALFTEQAEVLASEPKGVLQVSLGDLSTAAEASQVEVWVDGHAFPAPRGRLRRALPPGTYAVWAVTSGTSSLRREVTIVAGEETALNISTELETCVTLSEFVSLGCPEAWMRNLNTLRHLLGAERLQGVPSAAAETRHTDGWNEGVLIAETLPGVEPAPALPTFHATYLIPFGGAQYTQGRPVFGTLYVLLSAGSMAFLGASAALYADAANSTNFAYGEQAATLATAAIGAAVGTLVFTVVEAVVYGQIWGEP